MTVRGRQNVDDCIPFTVTTGLDPVVPSPPGLTRWSMLSRCMDCRIKSGNDEPLYSIRCYFVESD